jgi:hypothetical protein
MEAMPVVVVVVEQALVASLLVMEIGLVPMHRMCRPRLFVWGT